MKRLEFSVIVETMKIVPLDEMERTMEKIVKVIEKDGYCIIKETIDNDYIGC